MRGQHSTKYGDGTLICQPPFGKIFDMSKTGISPGLAEVIGQRVKALRKQDKLSQDELASRLRKMGLTRWTRPVVAALENGGRHVDLGELLALAAVLHRPVLDLVQGDTAWIRLSDESEIRAEALQLLLRGADPRDLPPGDLPRPLPRRAPLEVGLVDDLAGGLGSIDSWADLLTGSGRELERRIARQTGLHPVEVMYVANQLWGRSATDERDRRAIDDSFRKQHISRGLVREISREAERMAVEGDSGWTAFRKASRNALGVTGAGRQRDRPTGDLEAPVRGKSELERATGNDALRRIRALVEQDDVPAWLELAAGYRAPRIRRPVEQAIREVGVERVLSVVRSAGHPERWGKELIAFLDRGAEEERLRRRALRPIPSPVLHWQED